MRFDSLSNVAAKRLIQTFLIVNTYTIFVVELTVYIEL